MSKLYLQKIKKHMIRVIQTFEILFAPFAILFMNIQL